MTTIINTPPSGESTGAGFIIGIGLVVVIAFGLFFVYGLPALKNRTNADPKTVEVNLQLPTTNR